jgi:hypothetical protein
MGAEAYVAGRCSQFTLKRIQRVGSWEHNNEPSGTIKAKNFLSTTWVSESCFPTRTVVVVKVGLELIFRASSCLSASATDRVIHLSLTLPTVYSSFCKIIVKRPCSVQQIFLPVACLCEISYTYDGQIIRIAHALLPTILLILMHVKHTVPYHDNRLAEDGPSISKRVDIKI